MTATILDLRKPAPQNTAVMIGIDYDEFHPETYRGCFVIVVTENGAKQERRDFPNWDAAETYASSFGHPVFHLSSVDNYAGDLPR